MGSLFWNKTVACAAALILYPLIGLGGVVPSTTYAYLYADTLVIGNNLVERTMLWNGGNLKTIKLKDKKGEKEWNNHSPLPDLYICQELKASDGKLSQVKLESTHAKPAVHIVRIDYNIDSLQIRKEFRMYDDCPAIACDYYLKGDGSGIFKGGLSVSPADLKNIESIEDMKLEMEHPVLDHIQPGGVHWDMKAVEFFDVSDMCDNLVSERSFVPFRKAFYRGNVLSAFNKNNRGGIFFLKEAPCSIVQLNYHDADFCVEFDRFSIIGIGVESTDINNDNWTQAYGSVIGVYSGDETDMRRGLRKYQKNLRNPSSYEMIMMNTWGDRGQDKKVNEAFCLAELEAGACLGITHFQIDDGWQSGRTPNSAFKGGSFKNIWDNPNYWTPDPEKYPSGLYPVSKRARELGIKLGLWFNPSVQDSFADWEKDANAIINLYRQHGITFFKIDGLQIFDKQGDINLRRFFDKVGKETNDGVTFNIDLTAGRRGGYHYLNTYGNFFIENRYTDWGIYFPYRTLRNLWQLSAYVQPEKIQTVFLNKWRNPDKYSADDRFSPSNYTFDYLFAISMAGQPLAWFEGTGLPEEAFCLSSTISKYNEIRGDFHAGIILPIGEEPSGESWTGFQSETDNDKGYLLIFREDNKDSVANISVNMPAERNIRFSHIIGKGEISSFKTDKEGKISVSIPERNSFLLCSYEILD